MRCLGILIFILMGVFAPYGMYYDGIRGVDLIFGSILIELVLLLGSLVIYSMDD